MTKEQFAARLLDFAVRCAKLARSLPKSDIAAREYGKQLLRCSASVAANYRAACRGRSAAEFIAKLGIVEEESDESTFWLDLMTEVGLVAKDLVADLRREANEIVSMVVASINTARKNPRVK